MFLEFEPKAGPLHVEEVEVEAGRRAQCQVADVLGVEGVEGMVRM